VPPKIAEVFDLGKLLLQSADVTNLIWGRKLKLRMMKSAKSERIWWRVEVLSG